jgi:hypothetical protein
MKIRYLKVLMRTQEKVYNLKYDSMIVGVHVRTGYLKVIMDVHIRICYLESDFGITHEDRLPQ